MKETNERVKELILKYLRGELSGNETQELDAWKHASERHSALFHACTDEEELYKALDEMTQWDEEDVWKNDKVWDEIAKKNAPGKGFKIFLLRKRVIAAAGILVLCAAGFYFLREMIPHGQMIPGHPVAEARDNEIHPGGNKAILKLGDGSVVHLDSLSEGTLARQGNTRIIKLNSGQITYASAASENDAIFYNTITTPRGGQFMVILPDNSKVWINAASSLRFPTAFTGSDRTVELTGEAYFEITKNEKKPFYVKVAAGHPGVNDMKIEVLGTHFNVNAYTNEPSLKTTLLEGSVKITRGNNSRLLRPGQWASIDKEGNDIKVSKADVQQVVAWKNGFFEFKDDDVRSVMRQIARWYDVDIVYKQDVIPVGHFTGTVSRKTPLSQVLEILKISAVNFEIKGREIIVMQ